MVNGFIPDAVEVLGPDAEIPEPGAARARIDPALVRNVGPRQRLVAGALGLLPELATKPPCRAGG
jgi:hypothetical protein